jgi:hypothetical protein
MLRASALLGLVAGVVAVASTASANHTVVADHRNAQARPIQLGVSGSSQEHVISGQFAYCYAGTLGALVSRSGTPAILSNNHVLAKENKPDSSLLSVNGHVVIQQALLDRDPCPGLNTDLTGEQVASGVSYVPIKFCKGNKCPVNYADAATATVTPGQVQADGEILGVGTLSPSPFSFSGAPARVVVQKSGRTTGHTKGTVEAVSVKIKVRYDSGTALFQNQIRVRGCGMQFSAAGDSGSLIATWVTSDLPRPVGLLFAGDSSGNTYANLASTVLTELSKLGGTTGFVGSGTAGAAVSGNSQADCATASSTSATSSGAGGQRSLAAVAAVQARNSERLLALPEVVGHGIGFDEAGRPLIELYVAGPRRATSIPSQVEGVPVRTVVTGTITAY